MKPSDVSDKNRDLYIIMKELAIEQERLITEDQIDDFLAISLRRERLQREISHNDKKHKKNNMENKVRDGMDSLSLEIADIIKSIQEVDQKIEKLLFEKKEDLLIDIKNYRKGKKALRGYSAKQSVDPRFINQQG